MFFKENTDDIKKYITVNGDMPFSDFKQFLTDIDRTVFKEYLGAGLLGELQTYFNGLGSYTLVPDNKKSVLIDLLRQCSAKFALAKWVPEGALSIDSTGVRIISTDTHKQAFEWQINKLVRSLNASGYIALEAALQYLDDNIDEADFTSYKDSANYKENKSIFISSAAEFSRYCSVLNSSRINFIRLRPVIRKIQDFEIQAVLLPSLYNTLLTAAKDASLGDEQKLLIEKIKPALAHLTIAKSVNELAAELTPEGFLSFDNTGSNGDATKKQSDNITLNRIATVAYSDGLNYLKQLHAFLEKNKSDYSEYTSDPRYVAPENTTNVNDSTNPFYAAI